MEGMRENLNNFPCDNYGKYREGIITISVKISSFLPLLFPVTREEKKEGKFDVFIGKQTNIIPHNIVISLSVKRSREKSGGLSTCPPHTFLFS